MKKLTLLLFATIVCLTWSCTENGGGNGTSIPDFTMPQMKWVSYDWEITQTTITALFELDGSLPSGVKLDVKCFFGPDENSLAQIPHNTVVNGWSSRYSTERQTGLQPNTTYTLRVDYSAGGRTESLSKQIKTMPDYSDYVVDETVKPASRKIVWDASAIGTRLKTISPDNIFAAYARMVRVDASTIACFYHGGTIATPFQSIFMQTSTDDGDTWSEATRIISILEPRYTSQYKRFINPEITKLRNGNFLLSVTAIGAVETNENCHTLVMISTNGCKTWSEPVIAGRGRSWEPMVVQLPEGELELLVSSEAAWWQNGGYLAQEILCTRSTDNGQTWTKYIRASYSEGRRDGMPAAIVMQGNKGVLYSIEVISHQGFGSPSFVHRDLAGEWDPTPWNGVASENRWHVQVAMNNGSTDGAAPHTIQLNTGEIVMMAQVNPRTQGIWQTAYPRVTVCNNEGRDWTDADKTTPIAEGEMPRTQGFYYGSLFQKDENTIWLAASHVSYNSDKKAEYSRIKFLKGSLQAK